jgi:hypothetical protein
MKKYGGLAVELHIFLISALDGLEKISKKISIDGGILLLLLLLLLLCGINCHLKVVAILSRTKDTPMCTE